VSSHPNGSPHQEPAAPARPGRKWTTGVVALVAVFVALACYDLISGGVASANRPAASSTTAAAAPGATAAASARSGTPGARPSIAVSPAPGEAGPAPGEAVRSLTVTSATAYGPDGLSDGDHPDLAPGIINGGDGQPWRSSWYATPAFGHLQSGTGLLLDMGQTVNLSRVLLVLGTPVGADVQVRVGDLSLPAELPVAASASDAGGTVELPLTPAASGRYVLIWFTQLPPNSQGKYQVSVYSATVYGTKRTLFVALGAKSSSKLDALRSYSITICS
jgi:hypothetical protein